MTDGIKRGLLIVGFMLLTAVAVAGWTRNPSPTPTPEEPVVAQRFAPAAPVRARTRYVRPVYEEAPAPVVRRRRTTGQSVAIVGGSAGVGAAIGALAGGGKGAAIGALSGGTAGFVYDQLTRNKVRDR